jgi:hypothetical protein
MASTANSVGIGHRLRRGEEASEPASAGLCSYSCPRPQINPGRVDWSGAARMIRWSETIIDVFHRRSGVVGSSFWLRPETQTLQRRDAILGQVIHWRKHACLITTQACAYSPPDAVVLGPVPVMPDGLLLFQTES